MSDIREARSRLNGLAVLMRATGDNKMNYAANTIDEIVEQFMWEDFSKTTEGVGLVVDNQEMEEEKEPTFEEQVAALGS